MATLPAAVDTTTRREAAAFSVDEAVEALRELESLPR